MREQALCSIIDARVIRKRAAANRIESGVERVSRRRTRRCGVKHLSQMHRLGTKLVEIRRFYIRISFIAEIAST